MSKYKIKSKKSNDENVGVEFCFGVGKISNLGRKRCYGLCGAFH